MDIRDLPIDGTYLRDTLFQLLSIPSPTGFTDDAVKYLRDELTRLGISYEMTRRGAIRAVLPGRRQTPDRALAAHVDTLGAQVKRLKENGRLELVPIGHWSSRFAEGARCTLFTENGRRRGTIVPLKASGHTFNEEVDTQPVNWQQVELRVDEKVANAHDLMALGVHIGDCVAIDPQPELTDSGFFVSRHLDDKAGVAIMLAAAKAVVDHGAELPVDCHLLVTISEEVGSGASTGLHEDVAEMVTIDNGTTAPGQNSSEFGVTIAMADMTGPFDMALTRSLIGLCREFRIPHQRDIFRYYRCDSAAALEAGADMRTALVTFGIDASHGYERIHFSSLLDVARLVTVYMQSPPEDPR